MTQTSAGIDPIPPARKDDTEDVAWALSTAEAMHARGDRGDALKWLRRAAEAASEAQSDDRALELAKAAADLASVLGPTTNAPPPPPPQRPTSVFPGTRGNTPSPAPSAYPATRPFSPGATHSPSVPTRPSETLPWTTTRAVSPFASGEAGAGEGPQAGPGWGSEASPARPADPAPPSAATAPEDPATPRPPQAPADPEAVQEAAPEMQPLPGEIPPPSSEPPSERDTRPVDVNRPAQSGDTGLWPARVLLGDDLGEPPDEKTRIGVPAYTASAKLATESTEDTPAPPLNPVVQPPPDPMLRPSQAMRVVVWRAVDGVHVAPQGTRVAAISVDAVLVALDPAADLAAWLSGK
jgi:hypothetical protein